MKITKIQKGLITITIAAGVFAAGCELIVDFDRTRIPVETVEAAADANVSETGATTEAGADADAGEVTDAADADAGEVTDAADADADQ